MFKKPAAPSLAPAGSACNVVVAARCQQVGKAGGGRFIVYASLRDGQPPFVAQFKIEQSFVTAAQHDQFRTSVYKFAQIVRGQRSEEGSVGKGCVRTGRTGGAAD